MSENTISNIKVNGTTYALNDSSKATIESIEGLISISNENKSSIELANNKLDELLNKVLSSGGSSMEFYKCASVDTTTKTWSGYKAVLTDGIYTFEESVTTGLSYTAVTPAIDKVYTANALIGVSWLYDGTDPSLVFYAPFSENKATAETGQTLNVSGNPVYEEINGIPCVTFDGSSGYTTSRIDVSQFVDGFTVSCFAKPADRGSHTIVFG